MGEGAIETVSASTSFSEAQRSPQPMLASVSMLGPGLSVSICFDGDEQSAPRDETSVIGTRGTLCSGGANLEDQSLKADLDGAELHVPLSGGWFTTGFEGSMSELILSAMTGATPINAARENLASLELAFAACESANTGRPVRPGAATTFPGAAPG